MVRGSKAGMALPGDENLQATEMDMSTEDANDSGAELESSSDDSESESSDVETSADSGNVDDEPDAGDETFRLEDSVDRPADVRATSGFSIPRATFRSLLNGALTRGTQKFKISSDAVEALQTAAEEEIAKYFVAANSLALLENRNTLLIRDWQAACLIKDVFKN